MRFWLLFLLSLAALAGAASAATYNSSLGAPYCGDSASPCSAASALLKCNSNQAFPGPEPNGPNTVDACTDSRISGTCHARESVENLTITDLNSSSFRPGDTVRVTAWFYCYSRTSDRVALYYTGSTSPAAWVNKLSGTTTCGSTGYVKKEATFTLGSPSGTHAVRAAIKYGSNIAAACSTGNYIDHDDLAFTVAAAPAPNCPVISSAGTYVQATNYTGAPNGASPLSDYACVKIAASNVVYDCAGYGITGNGTAGTTYGILLNGSLTNVTVRNCMISGYTFGIFANASNNSFFTNITAYGNAWDGIKIVNGTGNAITNSVSHDNGLSGFVLEPGFNTLLDNNTAYNLAYGVYMIWATGNNFTGNRIYDSTYGVFMGAASNNNFTSNNVSGGTDSFHIVTLCDNNTFANNGAYGNSQSGFYVEFSSGNNFTGNLVYANGLTGFWLPTGSSGNRFAGNTVHDAPFNFAVQGSSAGNLFSGNTVYNSTSYGFQISSVAGNSYINNNVYGAQFGFHASGTTGNLFAGNTVHGNTEDGFFVSSGTNNNFTGNLVYGNALTDFWFNTNSVGNIIADNTACGAPFDFAIQSGSNDNLFTNNTVCNSSYYGFQVNSVSGNTFTSNAIYGNLYGFYLDAATGNTIADNAVYDNSYQIFLDATSGNLMYNNNFTAFTGQFVAIDNGANYWNRTLVCTPSIIGGNCTGGNFYSDYAGYTYDGSGIGDTFYLVGNTADYLPLTTLPGTPPGLTSISLDATSPQNLSTDNLTCNYALSGTVTHVALAWARNSEPFMALYLPFDARNSSMDSTLLDYSGHGNDATHVSGAVWDPNGGPNGTSAYRFDGAGGYISAPDHPALDVAGTVTLVAKVRRNDRLNDNYTQVLSKSGSYVMFISDNQSRIYCGNSTAWVRTREAPLIPNRYQTIVCVINGSDISIYVNSGGTPSLPSTPIYTIGDSITAQHALGWHGGDGSADWGFDGGNPQALMGTYQYWLDYYAGTYVASESINKTPLLMGEYEPFHYNKGWPGLVCDDLVGPSARFPGSYDVYGSEVPNGSTVILMCGVNDIGAYGDSASAVESSIQQIYDRAVSKGDHLIMMTITPYNPHPTGCQTVKDVNAWLRDFTTDNGIPFIDTWTPMVAADNCSFDPAYTGDSVHLNVAGAEVVGRAIWSTIFNSQSWNQTAVQQATENAGWTGLDATNAGPLYIGALPDGSYAPKASIAEVQVYPRPLSQEEVSQLFAGNPVMVSGELAVGDTWQCTVTPLSATFIAPANSSAGLTIMPG
ncbi:MAG: NosD domain-containing protein [Candidatus ainarchaeum sp.]|nr:NosD domain-containing protein [Candidatus ainarchaeum sp.]